MEPQNKGRKALILILALLKTSAEVGNAICSCLLGTLSAKNPFKNHIIGNITDYFSHSPNLDILNSTVLAIIFLLSTILFEEIL